MKKRIFVSICALSMVGCGGEDETSESGAGAMLLGTCEVTMQGPTFPTRTFLLNSASGVIVNGRTSIICDGNDAVYGRVRFGLGAQGSAAGRPLALAGVTGNAGVSISFPYRNGAESLWVGRVNSVSGRPATSGTMTINGVGAPGQAIAGSFSAAPVYNGANTASVTLVGRFSARYEGSANFTR